MSASLPGLSRERLQELLPGLLAGDPAAHGELYERLQPQMLRYFARRLRDRGKAEDCANEVFLRALKELRNGKVPDSVVKWLWGIAGYVAISQRKADGSWDHNRPLDETFIEPGTRAGTGEADYDTVGQRQALSDARAVIETLPPVQRELMRAYFDLSRAERHPVSTRRLADASGGRWTEKDITVRSTEAGRQSRAAWASWL